MSGLLPMSVALIASAALLMMNRENFIDYKSIGIFAAAFFFTWKFTVLPILICIPFLLLIVLFVPYLACEKMCRISVVERIRSGE